MMRKATIVFAVWVFLVCMNIGLNSCEKCEFDPWYTHLKSLNAEARRITGTKAYFTNTVYTIGAADSATATIRYDSLAIAIKHELEYNGTAYRDAVFNLFTLQAAQACSPAYNPDKVKEIIITSTGEYDANHPAGSNLYDIMLISHIPGPHGEKAPLEHSLDISHEAFLVFTSAPAATQMHHIRITYVLENGNRHSATLNNILVKN